MAACERDAEHAVDALDERCVVLCAVVGEFDKKLAKAAAGLPSATAAAARELIVELEQAGDSAKVAAEADRGASADSKKLVDLAHHAICVLKHELTATL